MLSIQEEKHCRDFLKHLQAKYSLPNVSLSLEFEDNRILSGFPKGYITVGYVQMEESPTRTTAKISLAADRPFPSVLSTLAHEYKHCLQFFVEKRDTNKESSNRIEGEAHLFGGVEAELYGKHIGYVEPPEYHEPSIMELVRLRKAA